MKFLATERELNSNKNFQPFLKDESKRVWELYQSGIIREIYFTKETHCAVIILECTNKDEACAALNSLPLVREGLIEFDVLELQPYDGFSRLFSV